MIKTIFLISPAHKKGIEKHLNSNKRQVMARFIKFPSENSKLILLLLAARCISLSPPKHRTNTPLGDGQPNPDTHSFISKRAKPPSNPMAFEFLGDFATIIRHRYFVCSIKTKTKAFYINLHSQWPRVLTRYNLNNPTSVLLFFFLLLNMLSAFIVPISTNILLSRLGT